MARTLDATAHAVRRDAFVDVAMRLMQSKGYRQMSIQDVLDETDSSKGAFYHYFHSKEDLLEAAIERITDTALVAVNPILVDPGMTAPEKLVGMFSGIASWKNARKDLMLAIVEVWMSDDNIVVRQKAWDAISMRLGSTLSRIIAQGKAEGIFDVEDPESSAGVLLSLIAGANASASRLFMDCQRGLATTEDARKLTYAYERAFEQVLGAPRGSLNYIDEEVIQTWFG